MGCGESAPVEPDANSLVQLHEAGIVRACGMPCVRRGFAAIRRPDADVGRLARRGDTTSAALQDIRPDGGTEVAGHTRAWAHIVAQQWLQHAEAGWAAELVLRRVISGVCGDEVRGGVVE